jgi:hypothetical protein
VVQYLQSLLDHHYDIYLISVVSSTEEEENIRSLIQVSGWLKHGLDSSKILFCSTEQGKVHMVRHVDPSLHMDWNPEVLIELSPFIPLLFAVPKPSQSLQAYSNIEILSSILDSRLVY